MNDYFDLYRKMKCPFCGHETTYGATIMSSGYTGCHNCYCNDKYGLGEIVPYLKANNYPAYLSGEFYKRGFQWCKDNIDSIDQWD